VHIAFRESIRPDQDSGREGKNSQIHETEANVHVHHEDTDDRIGIKKN
jgi:hypothetical protein